MSYFRGVPSEVSDFLIKLSDAFLLFGFNVDMSYQGSPHPCIAVSTLEGYAFYIWYSDKSILWGRFRAEGRVAFEKVILEDVYEKVLSGLAL